MSSRLQRLSGLSLAALLVTLAACSSNSGGDSASASGSSGACTPADSPVITLAAYSNVYDVYGKLISTFQGDWADKHDGQQVIFSTSFGGSTTQAQNVVNGFPADVVALSLDPDVQSIQDAGLITHDWKSDAEKGIVATSAVVFDVRPGNPKNITNWNDLTQSGLQILTPDPAQSGGAKWNIVGAYGASMRGNVPGYAKDSQADAQKLLTGIFSNVTVMDKSANDSIKNFQAGNGDVAITYEYAVLAAQAAGLPDRDGDPAVDGRDPDPRCRRRQERRGALRRGRRERVRGVPPHARRRGDLRHGRLRASRRPHEGAGRQGRRRARSSPSRTSSRRTTSVAGTRC